MKSAKTLDRRAGDKWEIAGVPQSVIDTFSKRTDEIENEVRRLGMVDARQKVELRIADSITSRSHDPLGIAL
jgi:hypothetical protein